AGCPCPTKQVGRCVRGRLGQTRDCSNQITRRRLSGPLAKENAMANLRDILNAQKNRQELVKRRLNRRDLFKMGLLTSTGYLVRKSGLSRWGFSCRCTP